MSTTAAKSTAAAAKPAKPAHSLLLRSTLLGSAVKVAIHTSRPDLAKLEALADAAGRALGVEAKGRDCDFVPTAPLPPLVFPSTVMSTAAAAAPQLAVAAVMADAPTVNDVARAKAIDECIFNQFYVLEHETPLVHAKVAILYQSRAFGTGAAKMCAISGHENVLYEAKTLAANHSTSLSAVVHMRAAEVVKCLLARDYDTKNAGTYTALFPTCTMSLSLYDAVFSASVTRARLGLHCSRTQLCRLLGQTASGAQAVNGLLDALVSTQGLFFARGAAIADSTLACLHSLACAGLIHVQLTTYAQ